MRRWREGLDDGEKGALAAWHELRPQRKTRIGKEIASKMQKGLSVGRNDAIVGQAKEVEHTIPQH